MEKHTNIDSIFVSSELLAHLFALTCDFTPPIILFNLFLIADLVLIVHGHQSEVVHVVCVVLEREWITFVNQVLFYFLVCVKTPKKHDNRENHENICHHINCCCCENFALL